MSVKVKTKKTIAKIPVCKGEDIFVNIIQFEYGRPFCQVERRQSGKSPQGVLLDARAILMVEMALKDSTPLLDAIREQDREEWRRHQPKGRKTNWRLKKRRK